MYFYHELLPNKNKSTWGVIVVKSNSFFRFLEESEDTKSHFEIIWPLQYLKKNKFFCPQKLKKKHPQKLLRKTQIHFFPLTAWAAQTAKTEEFMFQNVAYRPTVYKTWGTTRQKILTEGIGTRWLSRVPTDKWGVH